MAMLATTKPPSTSLPRPTVIGWWSLRAVLLRNTSPSDTISLSTFGISIPIADLPGMGLRMRTSADATAYDVLAERGHLLDLNALAQLDLVAGHSRAASVAGHRGVDVELAEHLTEASDHRIGRRRARLGRGAGLQRGRVGQHVLDVTGQLELLADDRGRRRARAPQEALGTPQAPGRARRGGWGVRP